LRAIIGDEHGTIEDILVHKSTATRGGNLDSKAASANPFSLVAQIPPTFAADRDVEALRL
jgi:hypothetical protein